MSAAPLSTAASAPLSHKRQGSDLSAEERPAKRQRTAQQMVDSAVLGKMRRMANKGRAARGQPELEREGFTMADLSEADCTRIFHRLLVHAKRYDAWVAKLSVKLDGKLEGKLGQIRLQNALAPFDVIRKANKLQAMQREDESRATPCVFDGGRCTSRIEDGKRLPGYCFGHSSRCCSEHQHLDLCRGCWKSATASFRCTDCLAAAAKARAPRMVTDPLASILASMSAPVACR